MRILFAAAECVPYAKTGGLGDVVGALPNALAKAGHEVHVVMPLYRVIREAGHKLTAAGVKLSVPLGVETYAADVPEIRLPAGPIIHFIAFDPYYDRSGIYQVQDSEFPDNDRRFIFLCRAALELGKVLGIPWDVVHCHDWHTALIPAYLKLLYAGEPAYAKTVSVLTIHNLEYQGVFPKATLALSGLPETLFNQNGVEFYGRFNFLKSGLVFADHLTTVSPTYAKEIQTAELGAGLDGVLRHRKHALTGILNGIDQDLWDPRTDRHLPTRFRPGAWLHKAELKKCLLDDQRMFPLDDAPLIAIISRLAPQKGLDLVAEASEKLLQLNIQMVILGMGTKVYHDFFLRLKARFSRKVAVNISFDEGLAHRIYAGSDMFLMPSRFEPCGLGQMIAMRYGTPPIVRHTGGLADTVQDFNGEAGNGFSFKPYTAEALLSAVKRACTAFTRRALWHQLMRHGMSADYSWDRSAADYIRLYHDLTAKPAA